MENTLRDMILASRKPFRITGDWMMDFSDEDEKLTKEVFTDFGKSFFFSIEKEKDSNLQVKITAVDIEYPITVRISLQENRNDQIISQIFKFSPLFKETTIDFSLKQRELSESQAGFININYVIENTCFDIDIKTEYKKLLKK